MADTSLVYEDDSMLSRVDRCMLRFEAALNLGAGWVVFSLILLATCNVLGRWLFSLPLTGYVDWVEQLMVFFALPAIAYAQRNGIHIRMDIVIGKLKGRVLLGVEGVSVLLMLCVTIVLVYGSYTHFLRAFVNGDSSMDIALPIWPAKLVVPVALSILAIRLSIQLWACIRGWILNTPKPVAFPLPQDPKRLAQKEAEAVQDCQ